MTGGPAMVNEPSPGAGSQRDPARRERRRYQRVRIETLGRFMLSDKREYPCLVTDMSPGGAALMTPVSGRAGERIVAYVDGIGRVEGTITRVFPGGFAMKFRASPHKRDKLATHLTWLANRDALGLVERAERVPPQKPFTTLILADGRQVPARVLDVSMSGAAIAVDERPALGSVVTVGRTPSRVVRYLADGIAVEFSTRPANPVSGDL
jgi:hypothetical protein